MGICLSCRRRKRRAPEKRSSCRAVLPLHVCAGECDKVESERPRRQRETRAQGPVVAQASPLARHAQTPLSALSTLSTLSMNSQLYTSSCDNTETDLIEFRTSSQEDVAATMANTISNMKMTNPIKGLVSKRRKRYTQDGFNLDLAYITDNLIAMGFPAERLEGVYRNHIDDVFKFLEQKHKDHYKIYNLCSERSYDSCKFHKRVSTYPFDDHNPPKIELIQPFCEDVDSWLRLDARNVAAVHCKAGKGRTGTMVCCYLLHSGQFLTASDALSYYGQKRTHDKKGVTIPSQRRYVEYYAALVSRSLAYRPVALIIRQLSMQPPPTLNGGQCTLEFAVSDANNMVTKFTSGCAEVRKGAGSVSIRLDRCTPLAGDVKVELFNRPKMMMGKDKLFHFWFNTFFVASEVNSSKMERFDDDALLPTFKVCLDKWQLDDAHKDKQHRLYSSDFKVELIVQQIPSSSPWSESKLQAEQRPGCAPPRPPSRSPSTTDESSEDSVEEECWESGESTYI